MLKIMPLFFIFAFVMKNKIKLIAFDADDTLWVNEPYYRETEYKFADLLSDYVSEKDAIDKLFETEMQNLGLYGYGAKSFALSMIETALKISDYKISGKVVEQIIDFAKELNRKVIELLPDIETVLNELNKKKYEIILATKGDLLDQERKLKKSGLEKYFRHTEVMSNKKEEDYLKILDFYKIKPENFLMIGNSLKSDILPVLKIGGNAIYIPFHTTWIHEKTDEKEIMKFEKYLKIEKVSDLLQIL